MGKGWTIAAKFAGKIDRRRLGALAVLILESVLVSILLSYNYGYSPRSSTAGKVSATAAAGARATDSDWFTPAPVLEKSDRVLYPYSVIPGA
jgi:hypothetical protein